MRKGWREAALEQNAREVSEIGRKLYESLSTMTGHIGKLQKSLNGSVSAYNDFVGSLERNVLPKARKFRDLKVIAEHTTDPAVALIEHMPRTLIALDAGEQLELGVTLIQSCLKVMRVAVRFSAYCNSPPCRSRMMIPERLEPLWCSWLN